MKHFDDIYEIYSLGRLHRLNSIAVDQLKSDHVYDLVQSVFVLKEFIEAPQNTIFLPASVKAAEELREVVEPQWTVAMAVRVEDTNLGNTPKGKFDVVECNRIKTRLSAFNTLLSHELNRLPAYIVERTGLYELDDLINYAENHLSDGTRRVIDKQVQEDFRASGRCLAFDLFTACGFHAVRALEATARIYYKKLTGDDAQDTGTPLGGILKALRDIADDTYGQPPKPRPTDDPLRLVVSNLAQMNNIYRKPLSHPEMLLKTRDDARRVFDLVAVSIALIADQLTA